MNTAMLLNNVLPAPANRSAHSPARSSSSFDVGSAKNGSIQQNQQITPQLLPFDNHGRINSNTLPKEKPAHNADFKNVLNRHIKSRKPADEPDRSECACPRLPLQVVSREMSLSGVESGPKETDVTTPQQISPSSPDSIAQPIVETSTTPLISDISMAGDTTPTLNTLTQSVDISKVQIADIVIFNDPLMPLKNESQFSLPDLSQQTQQTISNLPASPSSQVITSPDKSSAHQQQIAENSVSSQPSVIRNLPSDDSNPYANSNIKPTDVANHKISSEGQISQADYPTLANSARLADCRKASLTGAGTSTSKNQPDITSIESPALQAIHITKTNPANESRPAKNQQQNPLNQQSAILPDEANAKAGINQQLNLTRISQDKITDSLKKPDTPKTDFQNANSSSQIAGDLTTPESNANVTNTPPAKTALESAHNLTSPNHDPAAAIREQISQSVTAAAQQLNRQITIQLNPPELGKVSVKFSQAGSELTGLIEASNPRTRADINQQIPEILRSLEQAGVTVKRIDVTLSDLPGRSNHDSQRDNSSQFNWDRPAGNTFNDSPRQHFSSDSYSTPSQYLSTSPQYEPRAASHDLSPVAIAMGESRVTYSALNVLI